MSRMVEYIIGLRDQFSAIAAKVAAEAKKASGSLDTMGNAANKVERSLNSIKGGNLSNVARQADQAAASMKRLASAEEAQARARVAYANKASIRIDQMRREREAAEKDAKAARDRASTYARIRDSAVGTAVGVAGVNTAANAIRSIGQEQKDQDAQLRVIQFLGDLSEKQRIAVRALTGGVSSKLGIPQLELIGGYQALIQAGIDSEALETKDDKGVTLFERIGLAAKAAGESVKSLSEDLGSLTAQSRMDNSTPQARMLGYLRSLEVAAVAPSLSPDTLRGHNQALNQFLGIAEMTRGDISPLERMYEASALQNTLSKMGYRNAQGGYALKGILIRMLNPTKRGLEEMEAAGFDIAKVTGVTPEKMLNYGAIVDKLPKHLKIDQGKVKAALGKKLEAAVASGDDSIFDLRQAYKDAILEQIPKKLRTKENKAEIEGAVNRHLRGSFIDFKTLIQEIAKLPPEAMKDIFGVYRAPQGAALSSEQALASFEQILKDLKDRVQTVFPRAENIMLDPSSFSLAMDRIKAEWTQLMNALADTGALTAAASAVKALAGAMGEIAKFTNKASSTPTADLPAVGGLKVKPEEKSNVLQWALGDPKDGWAARTGRFIRRYHPFMASPDEKSSDAQVAPKTGSLPAAAAQREITVRSEVKSDVTVTAPGTITVNVTGTVNGPIQGKTDLPLSASAGRGQSTITEVPGPPVSK